MSELLEYRNKFVKRYLTQIGREKRRIKAAPRFREGHASIFGNKFMYHDNASFLDSFHEIFEKEIYKFNPGNDSKLILDCGANIGLSVIYFAMNYPGHHIIAFEPDESIFHILEANVKAYKLDNVELHREAVWNREETLEFYTDNGMGGRVGESFANREPKKIRAVRLRQYLDQQVDFLKIDIEGAEYKVLMDCHDLISKANNIFFEYHGHYKEPQTLHELLTLLYENGFHYYIKESSTRERPFFDRGLICEVFDMAINIFGYRNIHSE